MSINTTLVVSSSMSIMLPQHAEPVEFDWDKVPTESRQAIAEYLFNFALRQTSGDAVAGLKDKTDEDKRKAVKAKFDKIQSGEVPAGGGGRGASLSDEHQAMLYLLNEGRKTADKFKTSDFIKEAKAYFRRMLIANIRAGGGDPKEANVTEIVDERILAMIADRIAKPDGQQFLARVKTERKSVNVENVVFDMSKYLTK